MVTKQFIKETIKKLSPKIPKPEFEKKVANIKKRSNHLSLIFEDIQDPLNASKLLNQAYIHNISRINTIEHVEPFNFNTQLIEPKVWRSFSYQRFDESEPCLKKLHSDDYITLTSCLSDNSKNIGEIVEELDLLNKPRKLAIAFGNESRGASQNLISNSNYNFKLPMFGIAQSFNVATSLAITLTLLDTLGVNKTGRDKFMFNEDEVELEVYKWLLRRVKAGSEFEEE
jgi:tRNA (guanosine-2'-O-)-methyltransferase